ncbi:hypothetical protein A9Q02_11190 [Candidatus Chloroploca asiatica]|uniref:Uncharacterized protein n=1 Tax=Candidatus Chloroploca asiatica TaxID=1506545 RepID=A0A2H3KX48_9CHLR|nr:hypothetical protein A9Q02_11190 [Candidatus Chloroploca asiatica]
MIYLYLMIIIPSNYIFETRIKCDPTLKPKPLTSPAHLQFAPGLAVWFAGIPADFAIKANDAGDGFGGMRALRPALGDYAPQGVLRSTDCLRALRPAPNPRVGCSAGGLAINRLLAGAAPRTQPKGGLLRRGSCDQQTACGRCAPHPAQGGLLRRGLWGTTDCLRALRPAPRPGGAAPWTPAKGRCPFRNPKFGAVLAFLGGGACLVAIAMAGGVFQLSAFSFQLSLLLLAMAGSNLRARHA